MKMHFTDDEEIKEVILEGLRLHHGYCPCVINGEGKEEFKCPCKEFKEKIPVGSYCYCGLFIKDSD